MPKLEPRIIQKELEQGLLWPVYWIHGQERMKARELLKRIRRTVLGASGDGDSLELSALAQMAEERLDGSDADAERIIEAAQSLSLGGGIRLIVVSDAHLVREPDVLAELLSPPGTNKGEGKFEAKPKDRLSSVCVFIAKDLDGRRKFTKTLLERAAVVACEEVAENDRESWIHYLAKRKSVTVPEALVIRWASLDPWSLDIVDQEIEKYSLLSGTGEGPAGGADATELLESGLPGVVLPGPYGHGSDVFVNAFFHRDLKETLRMVGPISEHTDEALPLLGLLAWNARQLAQQLGADPRAPKPKQNPYLAEKLSRWGSRWKLREVVELQSALAELDFGYKQTPLHPLGLWNSLVSRFCRIS